MLRSSGIMCIALNHIAKKVPFIPRARPKEETSISQHFFVATGGILRSQLMSMKDFSEKSDHCSKIFLENRHCM